MQRKATELFPNLEHLLIESCELEKVSFQDFIGLENLEVLWLTNNKIKTLPVDLFTNMTKLKDVSLKNNLIEQFDVEMLEPIRNTIELFNVMENPGISELYEKATSKSGNTIKSYMLAKAHEEIAKNFELMSQRFEDLFATSKHSDSAIKVGDKEYQVHKCILASQSSVFDKMFSEDTADATKIVNKPKNFKQETFEEFLRFFYTKKVPSLEIAIDLLKLANEFDVPDLKQQCQDVLCQTINPQNALERYNLAVLQNAPEMKLKAFAAVRKLHPEIAEFLCDKPHLVNGIIEAKTELQENINNKK